MTELKKMRAVYRNESGATFSAPLVLHDGKWMMTTSDGLAPVNYHFEDDVGGLLTFLEYREEEDPRLHLEPKQPGQSSLSQLQTAAAKAEAQARRDRLQGRQQVLAATNQPDARKAQEVRRIQSEYASLKRPRGKGAFIGNGE